MNQIKIAKLNKIIKENNKLKHRSTLIELILTENLTTNTKKYTLERFFYEQNRYFNIDLYKDEDIDNAIRIISEQMNQDENNHIKYLKLLNSLIKNE